MGVGGSLPLPYDAKVEYLLANSQAGDDHYLDTGITPNGNSTLRIVVEFSMDDINRRVVVGNYKNDNSNKGVNIEVQTQSSQNRLRLYGQNGGTGTSNVDSVSLPIGKRIILDATADFVQKKWNTTYSFDGETHSYSPTLSAADISVMTLALRLFMDYRTQYRNQVVHPLYIYMCQIYLDNSKVRDFIPVRVEQTGYMYDKVSELLFGKSGTGNFVIGPDV